MFADKSWAGGDIASSIDLEGGRLLWLFGDSWVDTKKPGSRSGAVMVNNTVAVQTGRDPRTARLAFYHRTAAGKPGPLFGPPDGASSYWLSHGGIRTSKGLYLFLSRIVAKPGDNSVFGFRSTGLVMAHGLDPKVAPDRWKPIETAMPFTQFSRNGSETVFGIPLLRKDGMIYFYGLEVDAESKDRFLLVARVPEGDLEDFGAWRFYSDGVWQKDFKKASRLADHFGAELSVSYLPARQQYAAVYTEGGLSENIMIRFAPAPEGPWSKPEVIFKTPEMGWDKDYFCYAAKGHPELSTRPDELIVSYVCNSYDFKKMAADPRIYVPKFLKVKFLPE